MLSWHTMDRAIDALNSLPVPADRDEWWPILGSALAEGVGEDDLLSWCASGPGYKEADARATIRSLARRPKTGGGSLFALAREAGWREDGPIHARQSTVERKQSKSKPHRPAFDVQAVWDASAPATEAHPYISSKSGISEGLRVYRGSLQVAGTCLDGALVVPSYGLNGQLLTLQFIPSKGKKLNAPGHPMTGVYVVGRIPHQGDGAILYLCEGIGQAWACHQATSSPSTVSFGAGRMGEVAKQFRDRYPSARLVLVSDAGKEQHCASIAKEVGCGWVEMPAGSPGNYDANDYAAENGSEALAALLASPKAQKPRFQPLTAAELAALPPVRWRVRGVLPQEGIGAVYGPPGAGKSFFVLSILGAVASGREWFGHRVTPAPVLYVALEGEAGIAQRVKAYRARHGSSDAMRFLIAPLDLRKPEDRADLVATIKSAGLSGGVLCIDTLAASAPGLDENTSTDMGDYIAAIKGMQKEVGGLVLLVHHAGKDQTRGLRGHSSLLAALDCSIEVSRCDDRREWRIAKAKDGADTEAQPFRLEVVELGDDQDGYAITSCVVEPDEAPEDGVKRATKPGGGNMRLAYDAIANALKISKIYGKGEAPPMRPCLDLEGALAVAAAAMPCDPKRRRERAQSALNALVAKGNFRFQEEWLWLP